MAGWFCRNRWRRKAAARSTGHDQSGRCAAFSSTESAEVQLAGTYFLIYLARNPFRLSGAFYTATDTNGQSGQTGISLAIIRLMAAIVQGGLTKIIVRRLGGRRTSSWIECRDAHLHRLRIGDRRMDDAVMLVTGSFGGVTGPAVQALISRGVGANEQGGMQGSLTSLAAGIIGPPIAARLFGYFISGGATSFTRRRLFASAALLGLAICFWACALFASRPLQIKAHSRPGPVANPDSSSHFSVAKPHGAIVPAQDKWTLADLACVLRQNSVARFPANLFVQVGEARHCGAW